MQISAIWFIHININIYSSSTVSFCRPLKETTLTKLTNAYNFSFASSLSFLFLEILTLTRWGTVLTPFAHIALFSSGSIRTSVVLMTSWANFRMHLIAFGALFLNCLMTRVNKLHWILRAVHQFVQVNSKFTGNDFWEGALLGFYHLIYGLSYSWTQTVTCVILSII